MSDEKETRSLLPSHHDHLRRSGITDDSIQRLGLYSVETPAEARRVLNWKEHGQAPATPALAFPYPTHPEYTRLRPDVPRPNGGRYEAPVGQPSRIYVPQPLVADGQLSNVVVPLYLAEGEKKAIAACQAGLVAIAAPGVWNFHDAAARRDGRGWVLLKDLLAIVIAGRKVRIAFDSDIETNADVLSAAMKLAELIEQAGADPEIVFLDGLDGKKQGLDDLYVALRGDSAKFKECLDASSRPVDPGQMVDWLRRSSREWSDDQSKREVFRALLVAQARLDENGFEKWLKRVAKLCLVDAETLAQLTDELPDPAASDPDWMSARGYVVSDRFGVGRRAKDGSAYSIATQPINISEVGVDEDGQLFLTIRFRYNGREAVHTLRRDEVYSNSFAGLSAMGAPLLPGKGLGEVQTFLAKQENENAERLRPIPIRTKPGWDAKRESFALGRTVIGSDARAILSAENTYLDAFGARGSVKEYCDVCKQVRAASPHAEIMWASGYAGPLLYLLGKRGIVLSCWGKSLGGKSALQALSASAYGQPEAIIIGGDVSPAAIDGVLFRSNDLLLHMDDTQLTRNKDLLDSFSYQVANGQSRTRSTNTGTLREAQRWRALATVSGEQPLMRLGAAAGAKNRTVELEFEPMRDAALPRQVHTFLKDNHGHTGPRFIEALLEHFIRSNKLHELKEFHLFFCRALDPAPDELVDNVGVLVTADFLARVLVFGEEEAHAKAAAIAAGRCVLASARQSQRTTGTTTEQAYQYIVAFVVENQEAFNATTEVTCLTSSDQPKLESDASGLG